MQIAKFYVCEYSPAGNVIGAFAYVPCGVSHATFYRSHFFLRHTGRTSKPDHHPMSRDLRSAQAPPIAKAKNVISFSLFSFVSPVHQECPARLNSHLLPTYSVLLHFRFQCIMFVGCLACLYVRRSQSMYYHLSTRCECPSSQTVHADRMRYCNL